MPASHVDFVNRSLPRAFRGYDVDQTDRLVQDLADALARAKDEKVSLMRRLAELEARLADYKQREAAMQRTIVASQRMGEELRASAQKEAQLLLEKARLKADGLLQNAQVRLTRILEEAAEAKKAKTRFEEHLRHELQDHLRLLELNRRESASLEAAVIKLAPRETPGEEAPGRPAGTGGNAEGRMS